MVLSTRASKVVRMGLRGLMVRFSTFLDAPRRALVPGLAPSHGLHNGSTQPARVRRGSTGLKVEDNSQVCAN